MFQVTINGKIENYGAGTPYLTIARKHQAEYPQDIILVFVNGKLTELYKSLKKDCELKFVTTADAPGMQTYQRSATLMMLKAFYEVVGTEHIERVFVDFSVGKGLFVDARGDFTLNQELLDRVKAKMHEYADQKIPIMKSALKKDEAIELFHRYRMHEKAELFRYRRISTVNVYRIGGFTDYYYGYMAPDTSYIRWFDLVPYEYGFVLLLPTKEQPQQVPELKSSKKLFDTLEGISSLGRENGHQHHCGLKQPDLQGQSQRTDPDPGGSSGEEDRSDRRNDRGTAGEEICYDRRAKLLRKDHIFPPVIHSVTGIRIKASCHWRGRLFCQPGGQSER